jgi:hypothetical protein
MKPTPQQPSGGAGSWACLRWRFSSVASQAAPIRRPGRRSTLRRDALSRWSPTPRACGIAVAAFAPSCAGGSGCVSSAGADVLSVPGARGWGSKRRGARRYGFSGVKNDLGAVAVRHTRTIRRNVLDALLRRRAAGQPRAGEVGRHRSATAVSREAGAPGARPFRLRGRNEPRHHLHSQPRAA